MFKNKKLFAGVALLAGTVLGGQSAFAATTGTPANPATASTPVQSVLTAPTPGTLPSTPPGSTGPGGTATSNFQVAYVPSDWHFDGLTTDATIGAKDSGGSPITESHVGVYDNTFGTDGWKVQAELQWSGTAMTGATIDVNLGTVQENAGGTLQALPSHLSSAFNNTLGGTISGVGSNAVTIQSGSPTKVMSANDGFTYGGTYDVKLTNVTLNVPAGTAANTYNGNVNWDLSLVP